MALQTWMKLMDQTKALLRWKLIKRKATAWFLEPYLTEEQRRMIVASSDPVRYGALLLAIEHISRDNIPGSLAECGVYRGRLSKFLHEMLPERQLFLFDTFEGFDARDSDTKSDRRFQDTSVDTVLQHIGSTKNVHIRKGYFPDTAIGLEKEQFAFVMVDFDKYDATKSALEFFYPRTVRGGFIFVHDYTSPESKWACSRALNEFLESKPELPIAIPDSWGTALFRKI